DLGETARQRRGQFPWGSEQALEAGGVYNDCARVQLFHARGELVRASGFRRAWAVDTCVHMQNKIKGQKLKTKNQKLFRFAACVASLALPCVLIIASSPRHRTRLRFYELVPAIGSRWFSRMAPGR